MDQKKNQLGRNLFASTIIILLCLVSVFTIFSNLDFVWETMQQKKEATQVSTYERLEALQDDKVTVQEEPAIYFWGNTDHHIIVKQQMENMKEEYLYVEDLSQCENAEILVIYKDSYTLDEINTLRKFSRNGVIICVAGLPTWENLQTAYVKNFLGVEECREKEEKTGYRLAEKILFGTIYENEEEFETPGLSLLQRTEVYVSALEEKVENQNLTPLFWRYKESGEQESVYVINEKLLEKETGYSMISFLMTDIHSTYMYPVINAYCFAVQGMPYSDAYETSFLDKEYGKDSLGLENDILFPQMNRCEERYGLLTTWYSKEADSLQDAENVLLQYYVNDIKRSKGIIGTYDTDKDSCSVDMPYENRLTVWDTDFTWKDGDTIQIPYDLTDEKEYQTTIIEDMCEVRGCGFHCVGINIDEFLTEDSDVEWISYIDNLETVLGTEKQDLYWIERMTVEDAVYRIKNHEIMEPVITYGQDRVTVEIMNFPGEAYFYLYTDKKIKSATNGEYTEIADGIYFVSTTNDSLEILLYE